MGVNLADLLPVKTVELEHLTGRRIAVDAYNTLYQFLSIIRQPDGSSLMNSKGEVTSHLAGLLYRTSNLVALGIKPVFVFDGVPPEQKAKVLAERMHTRTDAKAKWDAALEKGDAEGVRSYAQQTSRLTKPMVEQAKAALEALGIPCVQAPQEGEAQAAYMCEREDVWAVGSQDFDSLLFGAPKLLRNMTVTGRRKLPRKNIYIEVKPELLEMDLIARELGISRADLIEIGLMVGTDFNEGVKGIGPKKALAAIKKGKNADEVHHEAEIDLDLQPARDIFLHPETTKNYSLEWKEPDESKVVELFVDMNEFSMERVKNAMDKMRSAMRAKGTQSRLDGWS